MGPSGSCRSRGLHPKAPSLGRTRLHSPECRPPKTAGLKSGSCLLCYPMPRKNRVDQTDRKRLFLRGSRFPVTGLRIMTRERGCVEYGREERGKAPWTRLGAGRQSPQPHAGTPKGPQGNATADTKKTQRRLVGVLRMVVDNDRYSIPDPERVRSSGQSLGPRRGSSGRF
jgi:hypothetical protein